MYFYSFYKWSQQFLKGGTVLQSDPWPHSNTSNPVPAYFSLVYRLIVGFDTLDKAVDASSVSNTSTSIGLSILNQFCVL